MSIGKLQGFYGFTRMPFGRDLAPGMLHRHAAHNEAVARITWCIAERAIGVITGEVGAGKTVSVRTVLAGLDATRHTVIYLPNPMIGVRGLHEAVVATFGGQPDRSSSRLTAQASAVLAAERDERGRTPVLVIDEAHLLRYEQLEAVRMLTNHDLDSGCPLACLLIGFPVAFTMPMWGCGKAPQPGWLRGFGGEGAGGRGRGAGQVSVTSVMADRVACSSTMDLPAA